MKRPGRVRHCRARRCRSGVRLLPLALPVLALLPLPLLPRGLLPLALTLLGVPLALAALLLGDRGRGFTQVSDPAGHQDKGQDHTGNALRHAAPLSRLEKGMADSTVPLNGSR